MPPLPAYGFSPSRLRLALSPAQHGHRQLVFDFTTAGRTQLSRSGASCFSTGHAVSARPVLGTALSETSGQFVRRLGQLDTSGRGHGLRYPRLADAQRDWLDRGTSLPIPRAPHALTGLAALSHSQRCSDHDPVGSRQRLTGNTQHLPGCETPQGITVPRMEVFTMDGKAEKMALFRYGLVARWS